jgi:hypothetical protein
VPAYQKGELSLDAYLVRLLAALCRQAGGELRVKGELVDAVGEATALLKAWDSKTQEVVLTVSMGTYGEVFRVVPERQPTKQVIAASQSQPERTDEPTEQPRVAQTFTDDVRQLQLDKKALLKTVTTMLKQDLQRRKQQGETP